MLESNPLKSKLLVGGLGVARKAAVPLRRELCSINSDALLMCIYIYKYIYIYIYTYIYIYICIGIDIESNDTSDNKSVLILIGFPSGIIR